jgi:hypothetical protein
MELNKEKLETTANRFLMVGILGIVSMVIGLIAVIIMEFSMLFSLIPDGMMNISRQPPFPPFLESLIAIFPTLIILISITSVINIVAQSIQYHLLGYGLEELGLITKTNMNNYRKAKRFYIFYPIGSGFSIFMLLGIYFLLYLMFENPLSSLPLLVWFLIFNFAFLAILILGIIGLIYYGIFVYKIGKNLAQNLLVAGGILLIVYSFVGAILVSMGLKKLIKYNIQ